MDPRTWQTLDRMFAADRIEIGEAVTLAASVPGIEEIEAAQSALSCRFDSDYFEFLLRYGAAFVGSLPVFGLRPVHAMGNSWSVVELTNEYRREVGSTIADWYVISEDGYGNPIGIAPDGRVMVFDHDHDGEAVLAETFEQFLRKQIKLES